MSSKRPPDTGLRESFFDDIRQGRLPLAQAVRQMRRIAGMTQPEYARLLGIAPRVLMDIERGHANPRLDTLEKLAKPFGLSVGFYASDSSNDPGRSQEAVRK